MWTAGFQFRDKTYRFVVNGRTGKVQGERPYSVIKIALAVIAALALAVAALLVMETSGGFEALNGGFTTGISDSSNLNWGSEPSFSRWPEVPLNDELRTFDEQVPDVRF